MKYFILLLTILLTSCISSTDGYVLIAATEACKDKAGIHHIITGFVHAPYVTCNNGQSFYEVNKVESTVK